MMTMMKIMNNDNDIDDDDDENYDKDDDDIDGDDIDDYDIDGDDIDYHHHITIIITIRSSSLSSLPNNSTAANEFIFASFKQVVMLFFNFINSSLQMITNSSLVRVKRMSLSFTMCSTVTVASGSFIINNNDEN